MKKYPFENLRADFESIILIAWQIISMFILMTGLNFSNNSGGFLVIFAAFNSAVSGVYYYVSSSLISAVHKDSCRTRRGLLRRDLYFIFILFSGPLSIIPIIFIAVAKNSRSTGVVEKYYMESAEIDCSSEKFIDLKDELKKQIIKQPVVDSVFSVDKYIKRGAIEILFKLRTPEAVRSLKEITRDSNFEIRFFAINKLASMENDFLKEIDWYKTAIKVIGPSPELLFQYASMMMVFGQIGLLFPEFSLLYFKRSAKLFYLLKDDTELMRSAWTGYARALRLMRNYQAAAAFLNERFDRLNDGGIRELVSSSFESRDFAAIERVKRAVINNSIQCSPELRKMLFEGNNEDICHKDIYPLNGVEEIKAFIDKTDPLDFDIVLLKISANISVAELSSLSDFFEKKGRFWLLVFLKILKNCNEAGVIEIIKKYIFRAELIIAIMALDLLSSYDLGSRSDIFIDLLGSRHEPLKAAAINFLGLQKVHKAHYRLSQIFIDSADGPVIKKLALKAVFEIDAKNSFDCLDDAFENKENDKEVLRTVLEIIKKYKIENYYQRAEMLQNKMDGI